MLRAICTRGPAKKSTVSADLGDASREPHSIGLNRNEIEPRSLVIALLVLAIISFGLWNLWKVQTRTLELPTIERPANGPANDPPAERPQRNAPVPSPLNPSPMPATP